MIYTFYQDFYCFKRRRVNCRIMNVMPVNILIKKVAEICKKNDVKKLVLIGSFATDTATPYSDIDFVVYGDVDMDKLEYDLEKIETLRKIDILEYETIRNQYLLENIAKYGKQIY